MPIKEFVEYDPAFMPADRANLLETVQRCRRMETRLTRFLEAEGLQTGILRPWWSDDRVMIPSPTTTIDAILKCIPEGWHGPAPVVFKEDSQYMVVCRILV